VNKVSILFTSLLFIFFGISSIEHTYGQACPSGCWDITGGWCDDTFSLKNPKGGCELKDSTPVCAHFSSEFYYVNYCWRNPSNFNCERRTRPEPCNQADPDPTPIPCPAATPITSTINQLTRINALSATLVWEYTIPTPSNCPGSGYSVEIVEKGNLNVNNTDGCNMASASVYTVTGNNNKQINIVNRHGLKWNTAYCWRVGTVGATNNSTSPIYTFRTNMSPDYLQSRMRFYSDANVVTTVPKCTSGSSSCIQETSATNTTLGGNSCWISGTDSPNTEKSIYLEFEYQDRDTGNPHEGYEHRLAFVPVSRINGNTPASATVENTTNYVFYAIAQSDVSNTIQTFNNGNTVQVELVRFDKNTTTGNQVIGYKVTFGSNFPSNSYNVYALTQNNIYDRLASANTGSYLFDVFNTTTEPANDLINLRYRKVGLIKVDSQLPIVNAQSKEITDSLAFSIQWDSSEGAANQSGLHSVAGSGLSLKDPFPMSIHGHNDTYLSPSVNVNILPINQTEILLNTPKQELINSHQVDTHFGFPPNPPDSYLNYNDLQINVSNIMDIACNVGEDREYTYNVHSGWTSTMQGNVVSDGNILTSLPFSIPETNSIEIGLNKSILREFDSRILNLSTNIIASGFDLISDSVNTVLGSSLNKQVLEGYNDLNDKPRNTALKADNWHIYVSELLKAQGKEPTILAQEEWGNATTKTMTIVDPNSSINPTGASCQEDKPCYVHVAGDLKLENTMCNTKTIFLIDGNLEIVNDFQNQHSSSACLFVVGGNIEFAATEPLKDESYTTQTIAPYDIIEGYFISNGSIIIHRDIKPVQHLTYMDGIIIRGGVVANEISMQRDLGLRNNMQPSKFVVFDSRYIYLLEEALNLKSIHIKEF
jgi:hypothetical protein